MSSAKNHNDVNKRIVLFLKSLTDRDYENVKVFGTLNDARSYVTMINDDMPYNGYGSATTVKISGLTGIYFVRNNQLLTPRVVEKNGKFLLQQLTDAAYDRYQDFLRLYIDKWH